MEAQISDHFKKWHSQLGKPFALKADERPVAEYIFGEGKFQPPGQGKRTTDKKLQPLMMITYKTAAEAMASVPEHSFFKANEIGTIEKHMPVSEKSMATGSERRSYNRKQKLKALLAKGFSLGTTMVSAPSRDFEIPRCTCRSVSHAGLRTLQFDLLHKKFSSAP